MKILSTVKYKIKTLYSEYQEFGFLCVLNSIKSDITYPFKRTYRFIVKMFKYGKLLWNDFEFDYTYLLKILQFKMKLMSEYMNDKGITVSSSDKAKELKFCVNLIDRILENNYDDIPIKNLEDKYGKLKWESEYIENSKFLELNLYREKAPKGTEEYDQERKEAQKIVYNAERQRKQDINYLFDTMKKRLESWWD